jgi:hypothetical protein
MKTNQLTINVKMGDSSNENPTKLDGKPNTSFANSAEIIQRLTEQAGSSDEFEKIVDKAGFASVKVNPFLARPAHFNEEFHSVIGDGCIMLPTILGYKGGPTHPSRLRVGESTPLGLIVSDRGVMESRLLRTSGKSDELREGDEAVLAFRSAEGRTVLKMEMVVKGDGEGGVILTAKKCKCKDVVIIVLEAVVAIIKALS